MPIKKALAFSAVINLFFLILCLIFGDLKFGAIDDYFMAARLTGAFGTEYSPHLIFVNAVYGYALLPLYHLFPTIGWYYIGEMTAVFISFFTIGYVLLRKMRANWGTLLATLFTFTRCCLFIIFSPLSGGITLARCFPYSSPLLSSVTYYCSGVANVGESSLRPFLQPCSPAIFTWLYNLHNALLF